MTAMIKNRSINKRKTREKLKDQSLSVRKRSFLPVLKPQYLTIYSTDCGELAKLIELHDVQGIGKNRITDEPRIIPELGLFYIAYAVKPSQSNRVALEAAFTLARLELEALKALPITAYEEKALKQANFKKRSLKTIKNDEIKAFEHLKVPAKLLKAAGPPSRTLEDIRRDAETEQQAAKIKQQERHIRWQAEKKKAKAAESFDKSETLGAQSAKSRLRKAGFITKVKKTAERTSFGRPKLTETERKQRVYEVVKAEYCL